MSDELSSLDPYVEWIAAEARRPVVVDAAARQRLLAMIRAETPPQREGRARRALAWIVEPRRIALPPLATAALAAGLVGIGVLAGFATNRDGRSAAEQPTAGAALAQLPDSLAARAVRFVLIAPQADSVALVGDFNGWDAKATPMQAQASGTWSVYVPLEPGLHVYSFVIDGKHFVPDPTAPIAPDDGFGQRNSVVVVRGGSSS